MLLLYVSLKQIRLVHVMWGMSTIVRLIAGSSSARRGAVFGLVGCEAGRRRRLFARLFQLTGINAPDALAVALLADLLNAAQLLGAARELHRENPTPEADTLLRAALDNFLRTSEEAAVRARRATLVCLYREDGAYCGACAHRRSES